MSRAEVFALAQEGGLVDVLSQFASRFGDRQPNGRRTLPAAAITTHDGRHASYGRLRQPRASVVTLERTTTR